MLRRFIRTVGLPLILTFIAVPVASEAQAQTSKDDIVRSLQPKRPLTRSLSRSIGTRAIEVLPGKEAEILDKNKDLPKINLTIEFEFDSDQPTSAGLAQLATLGEALSDPSLKGFRFMLAGHTDAKGSDGYNQRLSERRATAVRNFLVNEIGLDPGVLSTVGFGERRLVDSNNPNSPRNRRVEVVNLLR